LAAGLNLSERDLEEKYFAEYRRYNTDYKQVNSLGKTPQNTNSNNVVVTIVGKPGYLNKMSILNTSYYHVIVSQQISSCEVQLRPFDGFLKTGYNYGAGGELHAKCVANHKKSNCGMNDPHAIYF